MREFSAVYKKSGKWYLGFVEEIPGVNTQGKTLKEVKANLKEALALVLKANRSLAQKCFGSGRMIRESLRLAC